MEDHLCQLALDACTGAACAFWKDDGCVVERLGLHRLHDAGVSAFLLELRSQLEARHAVTRGEFARRLGRDV